MPEFEISEVETSFRKEGFTANLTEMGIKLIGSDEKAKMKAFLAFDDDMPPLTYPIADKKGKSLFFTSDKDNKIHTKDYGIGGLIRYWKDVLGLRVFVNTTPDEESIRCEGNGKPAGINPLIGASFTFKAVTKPYKLEDGSMSEGYTNFDLVEVKFPTGNGNAKVLPSTTAALPEDESLKANLEAWKIALPEILVIPLDQKGINSVVVARAKAAGVSVGKLGLDNRAKVLPILVQEGFLEVNENLEYSIKAGTAC